MKTLACTEDVSQISEPARGLLRLPSAGPSWPGEAVLQEKQYLGGAGVCRLHRLLIHAVPRFALEIL